MTYDEQKELVRLLQQGFTEQEGESALLEARPHRQALRHGRETGTPTYDVRGPSTGVGTGAQEGEFLQAGISAGDLGTQYRGELERAEAAGEAPPVARITHQLAKLTEDEARGEREALARIFTPPPERRAQEETVRKEKLALEETERGRGHELAVVGAKGEQERKAIEAKGTQAKALAQMQSDLQKELQKGPLNVQRYVAELQAAGKMDELGAQKAAAVAASPVLAAMFASPDPDIRKSGLKLFRQGMAELGKPSGAAILNQMLSGGPAHGGEVPSTGGGRELATLKPGAPGMRFVRPPAANGGGMRRPGSPSAAGTDWLAGALGRRPYTKATPQDLLTQLGESVTGGELTPQEAEEARRTLEKMAQGEMTPGQREWEGLSLLKKIGLFPIHLGYRLGERLGDIRPGPGNVSRQRQMERFLREH